MNPLDETLDCCQTPEQLDLLLEKLFGVFYWCEVDYDAWELWRRIHCQENNQINQQRESGEIGEQFETQRVQTDEIHSPMEEEIESPSNGSLVGQSLMEQEEDSSPLQQDSDGLEPTEIVEQPLQQQPNSNLNRFVSSIETRAAKKARELREKLNQK